MFKGEFRVKQDLLLWYSSAPQQPLLGSRLGSRSPVPALRFSAPYALSSRSRSRPACCCPSRRLLVNLFGSRMSNTEKEVVRCPVGPWQTAHRNYSFTCITGVNGSGQGRASALYSRLSGADCRLSEPPGSGGFKEFLFLVNRYLGLFVYYGSRTT